MDPVFWIFTISALTFVACFMLVNYGYRWFNAWYARQALRYERLLVHDLMIDVDPRVAVWLSVACVLVTGLLAMLLAEAGGWFFIGAGLGAIAPTIFIRHLEQKRREKLEAQLVDGITTLTSGVRAGLNLVQSFELLVDNSIGAIRQEFSQLLREYQMGLDLNQAMRNAADRIGSPNYRLLFTAVEMHRQRGGNTAESLERIAESIREIQRLEGKMDALTAQGRTQAWMMAAMPAVFLLVLYAIDPDGIKLLFVEPFGRILLLIAVSMIIGSFVWIRKIMAVDI